VGHPLDIAGRALELHQVLQKFDRAHHVTRQHNARAAGIGGCSAGVAELDHCRQLLVRELG